MSSESLSRGRRGRRGGRKKSNARTGGKRRTAGRAVRPKSATAEALFPRLEETNGRYGVGVLLAVAEGAGDRREFRYCRIEKFSPKPANQPRAKVLSSVDPGALARLLTGVSHPDRIRIAAAILTGADTHRKLSRAVGLKVGPLYHHIRELERAGILAHLPKNGYGLTDTGRDLVLLLSGIGALATRETSGPRWRAIRRRQSNVARKPPA